MIIPRFFVSWFILVLLLHKFLLNKSILLFYCQPTFGYKSVIGDPCDEEERLYILFFTLYVFILKFGVSMFISEFDMMYDLFLQASFFAFYYTYKLLVFES